MLNLSNIKSTVQDVAEVISSILFSDVTIISKDLIRIAATGSYKKLIGETLPKGCSYDYIMKTKKPEIIINKNLSQRCMNCSSVDICSEIATFGYPIMVSKNNIIGVIGIIAFNQEQRNFISNNSENISKFLDRLSYLLVRNLKYENTINMLSLKNIEITNIINSLNSGIIFTDENFNIKIYNNEVKHLLNINDNDINNKNFFHIFKDINLENLKTSNQIINFQNKNDSYELMIKLIKNVDIYKNTSYIFQLTKLKNAIIDAYNIISNENNISFNDIICNSFSMKNIINLSKQISKGDSNVMIRGESGTGKELFAKSIHNFSNRSDKSFIAINCSSIPDNLLESELFGYEKGAFTGANSLGKLGRFELADKGTLFLDEIGDLPLQLQPKLLRVLQEKTFMRLGGKTPIKVDFRLICATHKNLEKMVMEGTFREDLYYRLNVIPINIPPLRERKEDIPLIANQKLNEYIIKLNKDNKYFSDEIIDIFKNSLWKGNIRELENVIEYLVNISNDKIIDKNLLPDYFYNDEKIVNYNEVNNLEIYKNFNKDLKGLLDEYEKSILEFYINKYGKSTSAKQTISSILNIDLSTLYRKLYRYNLK